MIKSSKERAPRVGDWVCLGDGFSPWTIQPHNIPLSGSFMACWNDGQYEIRVEGPLPSVSPVPSADSCESWCGRDYEDRGVPFRHEDVDPGEETIAPFILVRDRTWIAHCSRACCDRNAASRAGGTADAPARVPAGPVEAPKPAPSACNWTCNAQWKTHGPNCSQYMPEHLERAYQADDRHEAKCVAIVGKYGVAGDRRIGYATWAAQQHGLASDAPPRTPVRAVRSIYVTDNWRDPDWLPNRETP